MPEWTCLMRSASPPGGGSCRSTPRLRLRYFRVGGSLATGRPLAGPVVDRLRFDAALLGHAPLRGQVQQRVERGADHVVGIGRAQALREDVAHARALEHGAHRPSRDHPGSRRGGLQQHPARAVVPDDLVRDGAAGERHLHHPPARGLDRLAHRLAHLVGLPGRDADPSLPIADGDERVEPEAPAALDDLGDAVDRDHVLDEAIPFTLPLPAVAPLPAPPRAAPPATTAPPPATTPPTTATSTTSTSTSTPTPAAARRFLNYRFAAGVRRFGFFALAGAPRRRDRRRRVTLLIGRHQNSNPPLRAPSATALTRPCYR